MSYAYVMGTGMYTAESWWAPHASPQPVGTRRMLRGGTTTTTDTARMSAHEWGLDYWSFVALALGLMGRTPPPGTYDR